MRGDLKDLGDFRVFGVLRVFVVGQGGLVAQVAAVVRTGIGVGVSTVVGRLGAGLYGGHCIQAFALCLACLGLGLSSLSCSLRWRHGHRRPL